MAIRRMVAGGRRRPSGAGSIDGPATRRIDRAGCHAPPDRRPDRRSRRHLRRRPPRRPAGQAVTRRVRARVGAPRLLELFAREGIPTTWFVPGHTLVTFPDSTRAIVDGGHEVATHGWFHEDFAELSRDEARDILERSRDAVAEAAGVSPGGFRAPYWSLGAGTLELVEAAGYRYDSSLMAGDAWPYRVRHGDRHSTADGTAGAVKAAPRGAGLLGHGRLAALRAGSRPRRALGAVEGPRDLDRGAALGLGPRAGRARDGHGPPRVHRPRPPDPVLERFIAACRDLDGVVFDRLDRYLDRWEAASGG